LLWETGKPTEALQAYERSREVRQRLADSEIRALDALPARSDFRQQLAELEAKAKGT
jgi:hypothetical protein